jgi:hypothetical protein
MPLVRLFVYNTFEIKFVDISNYIRHCIMPHAQDTSAFRPNVICRLLVTSTQQSTFPNINHAKVDWKLQSLFLAQITTNVNRNPQRHFLQHKLPSKSTVNTTLTICSTTYHQGQPKTPVNLCSTNYYRGQPRTPHSIPEAQTSTKVNRHRQSLPVGQPSRSTENSTLTICSTNHHQGQPKTPLPNCSTNYHKGQPKIPHSLCVTQITAAVNCKLHIH